MGEKFNFNLDWKFIKEDIKNAYKSDFNDENWTSVSLPHTYNDVDTFDNFMEGGHNGERSMFTGKTWYRKTFQLDETAQDKTVLLEFEGVRQAAEVYINGKKLEGKSENGFIPFGYDLTEDLHFGEQENVLAVMVDNSFPYMAEGTDAILSWHDSHWHPTHGGVYRNVNLYIKDKLHVTLPLYSFLNTQGVYAYSKELTEERVSVGVEVELQNNYQTDEAIELEAIILDDANQPVTSTKAAQTLLANKKETVKLTSEIKQPHRWSPAYPYMYTIQVNIYKDNERIDQTEVPYGVKEIEFTNNQGFFINGNPFKLKGWGQRPTNEWAGLGAAFPDWMHTHIQQLMKEAGANFIRWGHSAGAPADIRASDRLGLLTIQPGVDGEGSTIGGVYSEESYQVRIAAFRDMVIYFRNHPSIFIWEGGNQSVPDKEAQALLDITKQYDPYGGREFAHRRSDLNMGKYVDVSIGTEGSWELKSKNKPIVEGEYNREEAARRVWDRHTEGYEDYHTSPESAYDLTSEDLAKNQAKHYKKISAPAHSGGANWIFSDSTSHGRVHSEVARVSGVVDGVMLPKESFHAIKAIYKEEPQLHIIGHWNYKENTTKTIYVMSNAKKVELFINDISQGFGEKSDDFLHTFEAIQWEAGAIKAVGYDEAGEVIVSQVKETTGAPSQIKLTPLYHSAGLFADGADILHVDVEVVDAAGRRVPTFEQKTTFELEGPATWRGGYNSGKEHSTNNQYLDLEAGINRVAVRTTLEPGAIKLTAAIEGLSEQAIVVESQPVILEKGLSPFGGNERPILTGTEPAIGPGPLELEALETEFEEETIITDLSYSGINEAKGIHTDANTGDQMYADREEEFKFLPEYLKGSEYLLLPNADANYKALDLLHLSVEKDATIFIAHDEKVETPLWLASDFEETEGKIFVENHHHTIFKKDLKAGSTLTLGGNADEVAVDEGNMYIVFAKEYETNLVVAAPMF